MDSTQYVKANPLIGLDVSSLPAPTRAPTVGNFRGVKQAQLETNQEADRVGSAQIEYQGATTAVNQATQSLNQAKAEQVALQGQLQQANVELQSARQELANAQSEAQALQNQITSAKAQFEQAKSVVIQQPVQAPTPAAQPVQPAAQPVAAVTQPVAAVAQPTQQPVAPVTQPVAQQPTQSLTIPGSILDNPDVQARPWAYSFINEARNQPWVKDIQNTGKITKGGGSSLSYVVKPEYMNEWRNLDPYDVYGIYQVIQGGANEKEKQVYGPYLRDWFNEG